MVAAARNKEEPWRNDGEKDWGGEDFGEVIRAYVRVKMNVCVWEKGKGKLLKWKVFSLQVARGWDET